MHSQLLRTVVEVVQIAKNTAQHKAQHVVVLVSLPRVHLGEIIHSNKGKTAENKTKQ